MTTDLILGTAGHIDHGKTALVRALTGTDTDRLPEERRRGITIELGFAELALGEYRLGIVDVPGHERFVRNMLAGATGMDLVMLVVAADDSVKPQTREHLQILRLLDLSAGVVALTKCDLADPDWIELVEEEIRETITGAFPKDPPIVRTSAVTGEGLDELRAALTAAAEVASRSSRLRHVQGPFRMAIDRTFTIAGHGTVVTGTVASGRAKLGDELVVEPGGVSVRIRGLQNHDRPADHVQRGQRAAINLAGIHHGETRRGQELASAGYLRPGRLLSVSLQLLPSSARRLKNRERVRLHVGTGEILTSVVLLDRDLLRPGDTGLAQLFLSEPAVTTWNQPFVVRTESPVVTIGGGHILVPDAAKIRRATETQLRFLTDLGSDDEVIRASAAAYFAGPSGWNSGDLSRTAGIELNDEIYSQLVSRGIVREIKVSPTRTLRIHNSLFGEMCDRVASTLDKLHDRHPLRSVLDVTIFKSRLAYLGDEVVLECILSALAEDGRVRRSGTGAALVGRGPKLSAGERQTLRWLIEQFRGAGYETPSPQQCQRGAPKNQDSVPALISLAVADGHLAQISSDYYLHVETVHRLMESLRERLADGSGLTLSQIREALQTTRKYAVPICEHLDRIGFTRRDGDLRFLADP